MRLVGLLVALSLLPAPLPGQAAEEVHPYRPGIDVLDYDLSLSLPASGDEIQGRAVLTVARTAPVDTLVLDLLELQVDSVLVAGRPTRFRRGPGTLHVPLPRGTRDTLRVAVRYHGEPDDGLIIRGNGAWTAFGDNWPNRGRHWIPSVDHPSDKATVTWSVTAPTERTVVANGVLLERTPAGGGRTLTRWRESRPIPVYLMVIGAGPLAVHDLGPTACGLAEQPGCVPQAVYVLPGSEGFLPGPFAQADEIVEYFARLVAPFPYEKLAHVQSATRFGGMENATVIFYSDRAFREGTLGTGLIAHETAHQWFGDAVTEREWAHLWLSEGFATYFAQLWTEHAEGQAAFRRAMAEIRSEILAAPEVRERPVIDTAQTDYLELLNANSYQKGAWVLHMLRAELGDSAFFRGIRDYYAAHRHSTALTRDLREAMERASGRELEWFFDQWLRRPGYPVLETAWTYDPRSGQLALGIRQTQPGPAYRFPLTVEVVDQAGRRRRETLEISERETAVTLPLGPVGAPREVVFDPDVQLLASFRTP